MGGAEVIECGGGVAADAERDGVGLVEAQKDAQGRGAVFAEGLDGGGEGVECSGRGGDGGLAGEDHDECGRVGVQHGGGGWLGAADEGVYGGAGVGGADGVGSVTGRFSGA